MTEPVHLSGITYEVGNAMPIAQLTDPEIVQELPKLLAGGLLECRVSTESAVALGIRSGRTTLERVANPVPDAVILSSDSLERGSASTDVWNLLCGLGLPSVTAMAVTGNSCGTFAPALRTARNLIHAEGLSRVLVVTADVIERHSRYQPHGNTVLSDGAAACMVSREPSGPGFRVLGIATEVRADLAPHNRAILGARMIAQAVAACMRQLEPQMPDLDRGFDRLVTGNYSAPTMTFLATAAGMPAESTFAPHIAEFAHSFSADQLITLATSVDRAVLTEGERLLVLITSSRSFSLVALEHHPHS